jgi:hypothetical protein
MGSSLDAERLKRRVPGMTDVGKSPNTDTPEQRTTAILRSKGFFAEYTTGQAPSGEWFALGSVRSEMDRLVPPGLLLVGVGTSPEDAIGGLLSELESAAIRIGSN